MKTKSPLFRIDRLLLAALAVLAAQHVNAQTTNTWATNSGAWLTATNWSPTNVPTSNNVARFTNTTTVSVGINASTTSTNNTAGLLLVGSGAVTINNSSGANNANASNGAVRVFGWVDGAQTNLIVNESTSGHLIITNNSATNAVGFFNPMQLLLASGGVINVSNSSARVSLMSRIIEDAGETNTITKTGAGTLIIGGTNVNTWGGGVVLNAGVLQLNKASALGSVSGLGLTINGGSLNNGSSAAVTLSNYVQTWGGDFSFIGTTNLNLGAGAVNLSGTRTVTVDANALTVGGTITNTGGITKAGAGTLILNGANTFSGTTTVNAGTLSLGNANALQNSLLDTGTSGAQVVTFTVGGNNTYNIAGLQGADALAIGGNTLSVGSGGGDTTYSGAISGTGGLTKTGIGRLSLSGSSSYNGATTVSAGDLNLSGGSIASSAVTVASGASLSGYGSVGTIGGAGAINPGNSPGILTTPQVNPSGGTDFNFEMTGTAPTYSNAASSVNDLIRITGATPFSQALAGTGTNSINIYFSVGALFTGVPITITGGFFTDQSTNLASSISGATYNYYFADAIGTNSYNGVNYYTKAQYETAVLSSNLMTITVTTVAQTANFGSGNINGQIMQVQVVPEPSTYALLGLSAAALGAYRWRRRRRG